MGERAERTIRNITAIPDSGPSPKSIQSSGSMMPVHNTGFGRVKGRGDCERQRSVPSEGTDRPLRDLDFNGFGFGLF